MIVAAACGDGYPWIRAWLGGAGRRGTKAVSRWIVIGPLRKSTTMRRAVPDPRDREMLGYAVSQRTQDLEGWVSDSALPLRGYQEATAGFEPAHKGFADPCLTAWLRRRGRQTAPQPSLKMPTAGGDRPPSQSGRWDSNPRPSPWQGDVLPLNYTRLVERFGGYRETQVESSWCPCEAPHRAP